MTQIPLHKERGLDPHLTVCPRCNGPGTGITIGHILKGTTGDGRTIYFMAGQCREAEKNLGTHLIDIREVDEYERIPDYEPCIKRREEPDQWEESVAEGGVYWKCQNCHQHGVIKASPFAMAVRTQAKINAPEPCWIEFDNCDHHTPS